MRTEVKIERDHSFLLTNSIFSVKCVRSLAAGERGVTGLRRRKVWNSPGKNLLDHSSNILPILPRDLRINLIGLIFLNLLKSKCLSLPLAPDSHSYSTLFISDIRATCLSPYSSIVCLELQIGDINVLWWWSFLWTYSLPPQLSLTLTSLCLLPLHFSQVENFFSPTSHNSGDVEYVLLAIHYHFQTTALPLSRRSQFESEAICLCHLSPLLIIYHCYPVVFLPLSHSYNNLHRVLTTHTTHFPLASYFLGLLVLGNYFLTWFHP